MHRVKREDTIIRSDKVKKNRYVKESKKEDTTIRSDKRKKNVYVKEHFTPRGRKFRPFRLFKEDCVIGVSAFGVPRHRRNTMAAALIAVRHNRKKSAHLGEPEVNLCEKVPTVDECIKVGNVERLTHR